MRPGSEEVITLFLDLVLSRESGVEWKTAFAPGGPGADFSEVATSFPLTDAGDLPSEFEGDPDVVALREPWVIALYEWNRVPRHAVIEGEELRERLARTARAKGVG